MKDKIPYIKIKDDTIYLLQKFGDTQYGWTYNKDSLLTGGGILSPMYDEEMNRKYYVSIDDLISHVEHSCNWFYEDEAIKQKKLYVAVEMEIEMPDEIFHDYEGRVDYDTINDYIVDKVLSKIPCELKRTGVFRWSDSDPIFEGVK